jgi:hypothetical protein
LNFLKISFTMSSISSTVFVGRSNSVGIWFWVVYFIHSNLIKDSKI